MTDDNRRRIDQILDETFLDDLSGLTTDELRRRRHLCDDVDTELSYYRRLLHGRMDLLGFEIRRRRGEETRSLIEALPEIMAGEPQARTATGRVVPVALPQLPEVGHRRIDRVLHDDFLSRLPEIEEDELQSIQRDLTDTEREISTQRRDVYAVYEMVQGELTRRYREGLADADELLRHS